MAEFLAEAYATADGRRAAVENRAFCAAAALTREGTPVSFLGTIFVPEDETWFWIVAAPSADAVREIGRRAGLELERVVRANARRRTEWDAPPREIDGIGGVTDSP